MRAPDPLRRATNLGSSTNVALGNHFAGFKLWYEANTPEEESRGDQERPASDPEEIEIEESLEESFPARSAGLDSRA
jgi:hypothetical protein